MTDLTLRRYWRMLQARDVAKVTEAADHTETMLNPTHQIFARILTEDKDLLDKLGR